MRWGATVGAVLLTAVAVFYSTVYYSWAAYVDVADSPRYPFASLLFVILVAAPPLAGCFTYRRWLRRGRPRHSAIRSGLLAFGVLGIIVVLPAAMVPV